MSTIYLDLLPEELIVNHILPHLDSVSKFIDFSNVSKYLNDILSKDNTFKQLIKVKYGNINIEETVDIDKDKFKGFASNLYFYLFKCKIFPLYIYDKYLFDIAIPFGSNGAPRLKSLNLFMKKYENYILITPRIIPHVNTFTNIETYYDCTFASVKIADRYRRSFHLVENNSKFMVKKYKHEYDYGQYIIRENVYFKINNEKIIEIDKCDDIEGII